MKEKIKQRIKAIPPVLLLWNEKRRFEAKKNLEQYSDFEAIKQLYKENLGKELNLLEPKTYTEKLQWLKLFYRDPLMPICSDKYEVRKYLTDLGYESLLNDLIGVYEKVDDINFKNLPNRFVLKATHGSGWNLIVKDKSKVNWFWWKKIMKSWLKQNLYIYGREWNYQNMVPRIIIEKYLEDDSGELRDYKFFCMNGKLQYIQIDEDRSSNHKRLYVLANGEPMEMHNGYETHSNFKFTDEIQKMVDLAEKLSKPFPHVRVDFYVCQNKIYFGEFTFFDGSGFMKFKPEKYDYKSGSKLTLPKANYNIQLLESLKK